MRFAGKTVLVTGASGGLGRALSRAFAAEGAFVYAAFRSHPERAGELVDGIREEGGEAEAIGFDVRDAAEVERSVSAMLRARERIDVLVNNAAVVRDGMFAMMAPERFDEVVAVNAGGAFRCARAVTRPMMRAGGGAIVNVGSIAGVHASPGQANYAASKGAVLALTRTLAAELAPHSIRVNAVLPGLLRTGMGERLDHRVVEEVRSRIPLGRLGRAEEAAAAVLFLASEEASFITGQALVVDGGHTL